MKKTIIFCTPYYNEFPVREDGTIIFTGRELLPIEKSFQELLKISDSKDFYPVAGKKYHAPDFIWTWRKVKGTYIDLNRNAILNQLKSKRVNQILPDKCDGYFWVDADIEFTYQDVANILSTDLPVVGGAYEDRRLKNCYTAGMTDEKTLCMVEPVSKKETGLVQVNWLGMGFTYVQKWVYEVVMYPWYEPYYHEYVDHDGVTCKTSIKDDRSFCIKCHNAKINVWLDCDTVLKHHLLQGVNVMSRQVELEAEIGRMALNEREIKFQMKKWNEELMIIDKAISDKRNELALHMREIKEKESEKESKKG